MGKINAKRRFSLDDKGYLADKANPANDGKYRYYGNDLKDDSDARYYLLYRRLGKLVSRLFANNRSREQYNCGDCTLLEAILCTVKASQFHTTHPMVAVQHQFRGKLNRKREGMQHFTSIALFANDVECLLRELYGDIKSEALNDVLRATRAIVECALPCLQEEDYHADVIDYVAGIGRREGYAPSGSDHGKAAMAADALAIRAMQVTADPGAYCRYTNEFVEALDKYWPKLGGWDRRRNGSSSNVDDEKVYYEV
jgi:hypothetical protein